MRTWLNDCLLQNEISCVIKIGPFTLNPLYTSFHPIILTPYQRWTHRNKKTVTKFINHDRVTWELLANLFHKLNKMLGVTIGNIEADVLYLRHEVQYHLQPFKVACSHARADRHILQPHPKKLITHKMPRMF